MIHLLKERSREIFCHVVEAFVETGEPIGSQTLSKRLGMSLSSATIRNTMADLERAGLLYAPHTSAGRIPTEAGLKMFVHGLLEVGSLETEEQKNLERKTRPHGKSIAQLLEDTTLMLSGLSQCAGLVVAPKTQAPLKHIEFVHLGIGRCLVITVTEDGLVENRIIEISPDITHSVLMEASNYLTHTMVGVTLEDALARVREDITHHRSQLNSLAAKVVDAGVAIWSGDGQASHNALIIRGQSNLLNDVVNLEELETIRALFDALETQETITKLLEASIGADGVQIFIGTQNRLFSLSGCSLIVAPYTNAKEKIVGAIGIVGPTRLNYGRIIPLVDYTAKMISRILADNTMATI